MASVTLPDTSTPRLAGKKFRVLLRKSGRLHRCSEETRIIGQIANLGAEVLPPSLSDEPKIMPLLNNQRAWANHPEAADGTFLILGLECFDNFNLWVYNPKGKLIDAIVAPISNDTDAEKTARKIATILNRQKVTA